MQFLGGTPIGGLIAGWVAERLGARAGRWLGAVVAVAEGAWLLARIARKSEGGPEHLVARTPWCGRFVEQCDRATGPPPRTSS